MIYYATDNERNRKLYGHKLLNYLHGKKWIHHISSTYCSGSWLLVAFCSCSLSLQLTVYMSTDHYHVRNTIMVAKLLTCILRHAQIHPKTCYQKMRFCWVSCTLKWYQTVTSGAVPFSLIIVYLTNSWKREGTTTWQRCTKTKCKHLSQFRPVHYSKWNRHSVRKMADNNV